MASPNAPVTLTAEQIHYLNRLLSAMRHDVNGHGALITASAELMRYGVQPDKYLGMLREQPAKSRDLIDEFGSVINWMLGTAPGTPAPTPTRLEGSPSFQTRRNVVLQTDPLTLSAEQGVGLSQRFASMRQAANDRLDLIFNAAGMIRDNRDKLKELSATLVEQPSKITEIITQFSDEFEKTLGISYSQS